VRSERRRQLPTGIIEGPRRHQHDAECETPDGCAGGIECRFGPDLDSQRVTPRTTPAALRWQAEAKTILPEHTMMLEAADEIERLRAMQDIRDEMNQLMWGIAYRLATAAEQREMERLHRGMWSLAEKENQHG
jgi:hypothetical protein